MPEFSITVNGGVHKVSCGDTTSLVEVLRNHLGLVGTRQGCGLEQCGACRVLIDGKQAWACTTNAVDCADREVETVESEARELASLRAAFLSLNAGQCGYCLSGILMTSLALLREQPQPDRQAVAAVLGDHLCRCGAHNRIIDAVLLAAKS